MLSRADVTISTLGPCEVRSPLCTLFRGGEHASWFVSDEERILLENRVQPLLSESKPLSELPSFELAGPRAKIFFDPSTIACGIVTCGGLCPGLNDVIHALTLQLYHNYGVRRIYGFRHGYQGLVASYGHPILELTPAVVDGITEKGGSILSSSRGDQDPREMVNTLEAMGIRILFTIGGDGTIRGAMKIVEEIARRRLPIAVVGIPKTIDNDILYIDRSFGFETAVAAAEPAILAAHVEAKGAPNGIGLVKLMGRHSGFIACHAALAMSDVNFVLIPEVPFVLEGKDGFLEALQERLLRRKHAVIVVAEGAGQDLMATSNERDASGNLRLQDIGVFLRDQIASYFRSISMEVNIKYIDPSYQIRSVPASSSDSIYCMQLAHSAVHAGMAGKTALVIGNLHGKIVHVPMALAVSGRKRVDPHGDLWRSVILATGQPYRFGEPPPPCH